MRLGENRSQFEVDTFKRLVVLFEERVPDIVDAYLRSPEFAQRNPWLVKAAAAVTEGMESDDDE